MTTISLAGTKSTLSPFPRRLPKSRGLIPPATFHRSPPIGAPAPMLRCRMKESGARTLRPARQALSPINLALATKKGLQRVSSLILIVRRRASPSGEQPRLGKPCWLCGNYLLTASGAGCGRWRGITRFGRRRDLAWDTHGPSALQGSGQSRLASHPSQVESLTSEPRAKLRYARTLVTLDSGGALESTEHYALVPKVEQSVELGATRMRSLRHPRLRKDLRLHRFFELVGEDGLDGIVLDVCSMAVFVEQTFQRANFSSHP